MTWNKNTLLAILFFILPSVSSAAALTQQQANSLITVVQSSLGTPASAFVSLITAFSNITTTQASSLITVVQAAPGVPANAFVNLLTSFTVDTPATVAPVATTPPQTTTPPTNTNTVTAPSPVDVCSNIEGVQTTIPSGMTATGDECVSAQVTPPPPSPTPTTSLLLSKRLNYGGQASWPNGNNYGNVNDTCNNCVVLITEMPTTANVSLMEYTALRGGAALDGFASSNPQSISIYADNNLSTTHVFLFSHMGMDQTKKYSFIVSATDQNGNKYVQQFGGVDSNSNYLPGPFKWGENQTISWSSDYPSQYMKSNYYVDVPLTKVQ